MNLYSYKGDEPKELPKSIVIDGSLTESGLRETRTSLHELSEDELKRYGFIGPYTKPPYDENNYKLTWSDMAYNVIELTESEKEEFRTAQYETKRSDVDTFSDFFNRFKQSSLFKRIKEDSLTSLESNVLFTQIYSSLTAAETGNVNDVEIQSWINALHFKYNLTEQEKNNFLTILSDLNLENRFDIPSDEILSTHDFDFITNTIKEPSPHPSWEWSGEKWNPPVEYPADGLSYVWNEETTSWDLGNYMG